MSFFKQKKKIVTTLEIGNSWLKVIQIQISRHEKKVVNLIKKDIKSLSDQKISEIIKKISKQLKIKSSMCFISVPRYYVTSRNLDLPSTNPNEIKEMIQLQIGKQTPYDRDEIISDYQIIENKAIEGYSKVMLVIVHRNIVQRFLDILEKAKLKTDEVGLSSEGLLNWGRAVLEIDQKSKTYIFVDIGYENSDFEAFINNKLFFGKVVSIGAVNFKNKEEAVKRLIQEINHFTYGYHNEIDNQEIEKIIITGAQKAINNLDQKLLQNGVGEDIEIIDQFESMVVPEDLAQQHRKTMSDISITGIFGLSLQLKERSISLLPQELLIEKEIKQRAKDIYILGILLILVPIFISGIFFGRNYRKKIYLREIEKKLESNEAEVDLLKNKIKRIEKVKQRIINKGVPLNFLFEIHNTIPPEIYLSSINFDGKDRLIIKGSSSAMSVVFKFVSKLEESYFFRNVKTEYANVRQRRDSKESIDFEIICLAKNKYQ
ncbi:MAG: pilus assembly protein PilM [Candidatus Omnitrophica bacterium]|nr:pilus assembly protein PilM [Candidatus Omnitrophota bacterium]